MDKESPAAIELQAVTAQRAQPNGAPSQQQDRAAAPERDKARGAGEAAAAGVLLRRRARARWWWAERGVQHPHTLTCPPPHTHIRPHIARLQDILWIEGYVAPLWRAVLFYTLCIASLGLVFLLAEWYPSLRIRLTLTRCPLAESEWVVITVSSSRGVRERGPVAGCCWRGGAGSTACC